MTNDFLHAVRDAKHNGWRNCQNAQYGLLSTQRQSIRWSPEGKPISNVRFHPENTMALFRANGPPRYQPWATPKESRPTDRSRTESPPKKIG